MAEVMLRAGAKFDMPTAKEIGKEVRSVTHELLRGAKLLRRSLTGVVGADGSVALGSTGEPVGPDQGMSWGITRVTVTGAAGIVPTYVEAPNPAAGANFSVTVPAGQTWLIRTFHTIIATSAAAGNRTVELFADDGADIWWRVSINTTQGPTTTRAVSFWPGGTNNGAGALNSPLPIDGLLLPSGHRLRTNVTNFDVADQLSSISYMYSVANAPGGLGLFANAPDPGSILATLNNGTNMLDARAVVLTGGERLVIAGTGLTPGAEIVATVGIREVPYLTGWSQ